MTTQKDRIEAAIRHIKTSVDIDPWAMEQAVEALKAQEGQASCPYCHEDSDGYVYPIEKNGHAVVCKGMDGWWRIVLKARGWLGLVLINYCPMCGRRLNK